MRVSTPRRVMCTRKFVSFRNQFVIVWQHIELVSLVCLLFVGRTQEQKAIERSNADSLYVRISCSLWVSLCYFWCSYLNCLDGLRGVSSCSARVPVVVKWPPVTITCLCWTCAWVFSDSSYITRLELTGVPRVGNYSIISRVSAIILCWFAFSWKLLAGYFGIWNLLGNLCKIRYILWLKMLLIFIFCFNTLYVLILSKKKF